MSIYIYIYLLSIYMCVLFTYIYIWVWKSTPFSPKMDHQSTQNMINPLLASRRMRILSFYFFPKHPAKICLHHSTHVYPHWINPKTPSHLVPELTLVPLLHDSENTQSTKGRLQYHLLFLCPCANHKKTFNDILYWRMSKKECLDTRKLGCQVF